MKQETAIIILANGEQSRWPDGARPKQLLEVDSVPIIRRAIALFEEALRASARVVTRDDRIIAVVGGMRVVNVGPPVEQLNDLLRARAEWGTKRTVCLLGDVFYTDAAVKAIAGCRKPVAFYGRRLASQITGKPHGELVAMAWDSENDERMAASLATWHDRPLLWSPYRDFAELWSLPIEDNYLHRVPDCLTEIDDFTDDFDCPQDWQTWMRLRVASITGFAELRHDPTRKWTISGREMPWAYGWQRPANAPGAERISTSGYDIQDCLVSACKMISPRNYLEIGVDGGGSFFAVLEAAEIEHAVLCDIWNPSYCDHGFKDHEHIAEQLRTFARPPKSVEYLDGPSVELIPRLAGRKFDLINVDGCHTSEAATLDLDNCWPLLREGGMLVFDDVGHSRYRHLEFVLRDFMAKHPDAALIPEAAADWRTCALVVKT